MSRRVRHIHARRGEHVVVHRPHSSGGGGDAGCGIAILLVIAFFLLRSCG